MQRICTALSRSTNIDAIARASQIPRESVRRKVNELIADALVQRDDDGALSIRAGAAARLAPTTQVTIAMLDAVLGAVLMAINAIGMIAAPYVLGRIGMTPLRLLGAVFGIIQLAFGIQIMFWGIVHGIAGV